MFDIVIEDRTKGKQYGFLRHDFDRLFAEFVDRTQKHNDSQFQFITQMFTKRFTRNRINCNWCQLTLMMREEKEQGTKRGSRLHR